MNLVWISVRKRRSVQFQDKRSSDDDDARKTLVRPVELRLDEDRLAWLALALSPGLGPKRILDAVKQLETPSQIFESAADGAGGAEVSGRRRRSSSLTARRGAAAEEEWARVAAQGATIVSFGCPEYPERLKEIYDPPPVLWVRGRCAVA